MLVSYNAQYQLEEHASMRHMTPLFYEAGVALWRAWWHHLPPEEQASPPTLCAIQPFDGARGDFMNYHTDTRGAADPGRIAPVLSLSLLDDMIFWYRKYPDHIHQQGVELRDGMSMMWPVKDDHAYKHGVWFPKGVRSGKRVSVVYRWAHNPTPVRYALEYPHRVMPCVECEVKV